MMEKQGKESFLLLVIFKKEENMRVTKRQLKSIIKEFLNTGMAKQKDLTSYEKFTTDFAKGYNLAFTSLGLKPDIDGKFVYPVFKAELDSIFSGQAESLNESDDGNPEGSLEHMWKFYKNQGETVPTEVEKVIDYKAILDSDKYDEIAERYEALKEKENNKTITVEEEIELEKILRELPGTYVGKGGQTIASLDRQQGKEDSIPAYLKNLTPDIGAISPILDGLNGTFAGLLFGGVPSALVALFTQQVLPQYSDAITLGTIAANGLLVGLMFAFSSSSEILKKYRESLRDAGDMFDTPYGGNVSPEQYQAFLDKQADQIADANFERLKAEAESNFDAYIAEVEKTEQLKLEKIEAFYAARRERKAQRISKK